MTHQPLLRAVACLLLVARCFLGHAESGVLTDMPEPGARAVYYDIEITGKVLRIDYLARTARTIGILGLEPNGLAPIIDGWYCEDKGKTTFVFRDFANRYVSFCPPNTKARSLPVTWYSCYMIPLSHDSYLVDYDHIRMDPTRHLTYDCVKNAVRADGPDAFPFAIPASPLVARGSKNNTYFVTNEDRTAFRLFECGSGKISSSEGAAALVSESGSDVWVSFVAAKDGCALVYDRDNKTQTCRYYLVDLFSQKVLASSASMPNIVGCFVLNRPRDKDCSIWCIDSTIESYTRGRVSTGRVWRLARAGDRLIQSADLRFDPVKQTVLVDDNGDLRVAPRIAFDYVSMTKVSRDARRELPAAAEWETGPVTAEMNRILKDYDAERPERLAQPGVCKLEILEEDVRKRQSSGEGNQKQAK